jgi:hypothetical protein
MYICRSRIFYFDILPLVLCSRVISSRLIDGGLGLGRGLDIRPEPVFVNLLRSPEIYSQPGGIDSVELIPGLLKLLQIRALHAVSCIFVQAVRI